MIGSAALNNYNARSAFFLQYLSLILIILVFSVGAFLRGSQTVKEEETAFQQPAVDVKPKHKHAVRSLLNELHYNNLISKDTEQVNADVVAALKVILLNHDVDAEFYLNPETSSEDEYRSALRQAIILEDYLEQAELPQNSWRVFISETPAKEQATVKLIKFEVER